MNTTSILFGHDTTERIVSVEVVGQELVTYRRLVDDSVDSTREPFRPWLLTTADFHAGEDFPKAISEPLLGGELNRLHRFERWNDFLDARDRLRNRSFSHLAYASSIKNALVLNGRTLFKGMAMSDVRHMQVDIETDGLDSNDPNCLLLVIAVGDNRGLLDTLTGPEPELLRKFIALVRERDPDIIEGHNILRFDLPFIMARAQRHGIRLTLGRDGTELRQGASRSFAVGGTDRPFRPAFIHGRHVIDTYYAVQRFDTARGELTSYGLKEVARNFGIAPPDRIELPGAEIGKIYRTDPERVLEYARQDIIETAGLAELVTATEFYQTQMVPDSYSASAMAGTGEKINSILIRAYLSQGHGIPLPVRGEMFPGGYTEVRAVGVIERVVKADVESLYPSLMLTHGIKPRSDSLDVFIPALRELTQRRLEAKSKMQASIGAERLYWDGLQGSSKILINSFYGYLAADVFHFNDGEAAADVTRRGRDIVKQVAADMEASGAKVIEIDTDGVYFVPPVDVLDQIAEQAYVERMGAGLDAGIRLAFDGRYRAMISVKTKNYVLEGYDGKLRFTGASLRSRADEPFGKEFIAEAAALLLRGSPKDVAALYQQRVKEIREGQLALKKLARRERITEKTRTSNAKKRSKAVAGDAAVGDFIWVYERRDGTLGLMDDYELNGRDENRAYYIDKLYKFISRLREAFGVDFDRLFPRPVAGELPMQETLDLFG
jgi:DNA polymerase elongation subunit (family B)